MQELAQLAMEIAYSLAKNGERDSFWCWQPDMMEEYWRILPPPLRFEVEFLVAQIRKVVPVEFDFMVEFDDSGVHLWLENADGWFYFLNDGSPFLLREELFALLRETDWEQIRAEKSAKGK